MKSIVNILILFVYLSGSLGINLQIHYCGGELSSISFNKPADDCCSCDEDSDCCSNEIVKDKRAGAHMFSVAQLKIDFPAIA
ncbi:MAG: hypothetical protein R2850_02695 [Bacteroidia bacterium]